MRHSRTMNVQIADTFTASFNRLSGQGRKAVKVINHLGDEVMKVFNVK